ncbi:hypothetical protein JOM56_001037 [Amanita muscaria]
MCVAADVVGTTISQCYQYPLSRILLLQAPTRLTALACNSMDQVRHSHQKWSKPCGHQCTSSSSSESTWFRKEEIPAVRLTSSGAAPSAICSLAPVYWEIKERFTCYRIDILHSSSDDLKPHLEAVCNFIDKTLKKGESVLNHCQHCLSKRLPTLPTCPSRHLPAQGQWMLTTSHSATEYYLRPSSEVAASSAFTSLSSNYFNFDFPSPDRSLSSIPSITTVRNNHYFPDPNGINDVLRNQKNYVQNFSSVEECSITSQACRT